MASGKVRVPVLGTVGKSVLIESRATPGATIGRDLRLPDGRVPSLSELAAALAVPSAPPTGSGVQATTWSLILQRPANLLSLAALTGEGLAARASDGQWFLRSLAVADPGRLALSNASGAAGNPTLDLATVTQGDTGALLAVGLDSYGRVVSNRSVAASDIPNLDASKITTGTFSNDRISEASVTQHEGALSIDWSQLDSVPLTFPSTIAAVSGLGDALNAKEDDLGLPAADGYVLSSLEDGTRSWVPMSGGGTWGSITGTLSDQTDLQTALNLKANDADVVNLAGNQTITGSKTFTAEQTQNLPKDVAGIFYTGTADTTANPSPVRRFRCRGGASIVHEVVRASRVEYSIGTSPNYSTPLYSFEVSTGEHRCQTIELGHASDTTLSRIAAGRVAIEGGEIAKLNASVAFSATQTFGATPAAPATTGAQVRHADGNLYDIGLNVMPPVTINAAVTFARTHVGKELIHNEATARAWSTPASSDTSVPIGATIKGVNVGTGAITLTQGSGVTLRRFNGLGASATGNRTVSQGGEFMIRRVSASEWYVSGNAGLD